MYKSNGLNRPSSGNIEPLSGIVFDADGNMISIDSLSPKEREIYGIPEPQEPVNTYV